jgi:hypothetical protein
VKTFSAWIDDFWFVDPRYDLKSQFTQEFRLIESERGELIGTTLRRNQPFAVETLRETFEVPDRDTPINIYRCSGRGYDVFRTAFLQTERKISVFYYRGDSAGESGSGFYWLKKKRLTNVLHALEPAGLIVSDGSNARREFAQRNRQIPRGEVPLPDEFEYKSVQLNPVARLDDRYGPTFVWRCTSHE